LAEEREKILTKHLDAGDILWDKIAKNGPIDKEGCLDRNWRPDAIEVVDDARVLMTEVDEGFHFDRQIPCEVARAHGLFTSAISSGLWPTMFRIGHKNGPNDPLPDKTKIKEFVKVYDDEAEIYSNKPRIVFFAHDIRYIERFKVQWNKVAKDLDVEWVQRWRSSANP